MHSRPLPLEAGATENQVRWGRGWGAPWGLRGGKGLEGYLRKTLEGFGRDSLESLREIWVLRDHGILGEGGRFLWER